MSRPEVLDNLSAGELRAALGKCRIGCEIIVLAETTSTNDFIFQMITPAVPEGLVIFAEHQTAGRGQRNNQWESPAGKGLWFSIFLRPQIPVAESYRLTNWAAESINHIIRTELELDSAIKLPNDILIQGRKVAGVLAEMRVVEGGSYVAIVGIGINMNQETEDFSQHLRTRAISLAIATGRQIDRRRFAVALLRDLDRTYAPSFGS